MLSCAACSRLTSTPMNALSNRWRVLSDSYAIAMILLAITGLWMWARGRGAKEMVVSVFALAALATGSAFVLAFL